jgi:hypothetical protein
MKQVVFSLIVFVTISCSSARDTTRSGDIYKQYEFSTNSSGEGISVSVELKRGEAFYYPLMAIWLEDMDGNYLQTLYVSKTVATGVFKFGKQEGSDWVEAPKRAPQTLPYWAHKRGVLASDGLYMPEPQNPVADAYTGATPTTGFILKSKADGQLPQPFKVLFEINQNWDWNQYWTNNKFPGNMDYAMSAQPALVFEVTIDGSSPDGRYKMLPVGHSHYSGETGELFRDISTLTSALRIVDSIIVSVFQAGAR